MIHLTDKEFGTMFALAMPKFNSPEHHLLKETMEKITKRNFPVEYAEREKRKADEALAEIEAGCAPSAESKQLYRNILATFGEDVTGEDLINYGRQILEESASA